MAAINYLPPLVHQLPAPKPIQIWLSVPEHKHLVYDYIYTPREHLNISLKPQQNFKNFTFYTSISKSYHFRNHIKTRPEHFNLDPKIRTGTDPKISEPEPDRKFISTFWVQIFFTWKNRNRKGTDPNRPGPEKNRPE